MLRMAAPALVGVLALHQFPALPPPGWAIPLTILALLVAGGPARGLLLPVLAGFAWTWWVAAGVLGARLPAELHGQDLALEGYVASFVSGDEQRLTFDFQVYSNHRRGDLPGRWRLSWYRPSHAVSPGQDLRILVRARQAHTLGNPAGFDYQGWLFRQRLGGTGYVRTLAEIHPPRAGLAQWWLRQRARLYDQLVGYSGAHGTFLGALAVGARHEFTAADWEVLRRTGTSHLVAISGLHVGLVAGAAFLLLRALLLRLPWIPISVRAADLAAWLAVAFAALYCALAGFGVPAQRALLMLCMAAAAFGFRRRLAPGDAFAAALLAVLGTDPLAVLGAGFWLSFGAVAGLLMGLMPRTLRSVDTAQSHSGIRRSVAALARTQGAVTLALAPVLLMSFGELALLSPLVNLVAIPWFSFVLVPATLGLTLLFMLQPELARILVPILSWLVEQTWWCLDRVAAVPWATLTWPTRPVPLVMLAALGTMAYFLARGFAGRGLFLFALLPLVTWRPAQLPQGSVRLTVLDVGQGLAALLETRNHVILYDAGPAIPGGFDAGASVVVPALRARGWHALDRLVIGHGDQDHAGGSAAVLRVFPDAGLIVGPSVELQGMRCRAGFSWVRDGVFFSFLHPADGGDSDNNGSCVLRVAGPGGSLLLTGDIERAAEAELIRRGAPLRADVVVVPHHGSPTSSTPEFVNAVRPSMAVIPVGFRNRWGLPNPGVVARWRGAGARVLTTAESGSIALVLGPAGMRLERLGRRTRYWHTL